MCIDICLRTYAINGLSFYHTYMYTTDKYLIRMCCALWLRCTEIRVIGSMMEKASTRWKSVDIGSGKNNQVEIDKDMEFIMIAVV